MCLVAQSCPTVCDPSDYSLPGSSVHMVFQARILEWVAISSLGDILNPGIKPVFPLSPALLVDFLPTKPSWIHVQVWLSPFAFTWSYDNTVNELYPNTK